MLAAKWVKAVWFHIKTKNKEKTEKKEKRKQLKTKPDQKPRVLAKKIHSKA